MEIMVGDNGPNKLTSTPKRSTLSLNLSVGNVNCVMQTVSPVCVSVCGQAGQRTHQLSKSAELTVLQQ